jgi:hypothetical protein
MIYSPLQSIAQKILATAINKMPLQCLPVSPIERKTG